MQHLGVLLALAAVPAWAGDDCGPLRRQPYAPYTFMGFACRDMTCNAHKQGFAWADRSHITDAAACAGSPNPGFREGCRAFVHDSVTAEQSGFQWAALAVRGLPQMLMSPSSAWIVKIGVCDIIIRIPAARARHLTLPGMTPK